MGSLYIIKEKENNFLPWASSEKSAASSVAKIKSGHYQISRQSKSLNDGKKEDLQKIAAPPAHTHTHTGMGGMLSPFLKHC